MTGLDYELDDRKTAGNIGSKTSGRIVVKCNELQQINNGAG